MVTRALLMCVVCLCTQLVIAGDWPQILGPHRDGIAENEKLVTTLPKGGPKSLWSHPVGHGLAGVAVAEGAAYVFHRKDGQETLEALDATTGKPRWTAAWPASYGGGFIEDDGPRCVPVVHGTRVYAYGAAGMLKCCDTKTGKVVWGRNLVEDYQSDLGYFGVGSTPLIEGQTLIVNVGGARANAGIVGLAVDSGKELWHAVSDTASYSSPVAVTVDGTRHVLCVTRLKLVSLDPATGKVRFEFPFGKRGPTVNGATPVVVKNHVLLTASYGIGATLAKIHADHADIVRNGDDLLSSQYTTPVIRDGWAYGIDGRQDQGDASLVCLDPITNKVAWREDNFGMATLILADTTLLCMKTDGTLVMVAADPKACKELTKATLFTDTCRALPALANGLLYVRDTGTLKCFDLRK